MTVTPEHIRIEHEAALASLNPQQRRALDRLREARQQSNVNGRSPRENLLTMFRREADVRRERLNAA